jgi:hypothetical protein
MVLAVELRARHFEGPQQDRVCTAGRAVVWDLGSTESCSPTSQKRIQTIQHQNYSVHILR